jgi:hypothetical protein
LAEGFLACVSAQVVVAEGACGFADEVEPAGPGGECDDRLRSVGEVEGSAVVADGFEGRGAPERAWRRCRRASRV